jgi:hypothetical protein
LASVCSLASHSTVVGFAKTNPRFRCAGVAHHTPKHVEANRVASPPWGACLRQNAPCRAQDLRARVLRPEGLAQPSQAGSFQLLAESRGKARVEGANIGVGDDLTDLRV